MSRKFSDYAAVLVTAALVLPAQNAAAAGIGYDAEYRADYTDNAYLAEGDETKLDELTHNYRVGLFGNLSSGKVKADFIANLEYLDYQHDRFDDEALSSFIGVSEFALTSRSLSWVVGDALGYYDPDPGLGFNTRNMERVNYFMTGPVLQYAVGANHDLNAKLYYTNHDRAGEDEDFDRVNANIGWSMYLNNRESLGMDLDHILMLYDEAADRGDYTTTDLTFSYSRTGVANNFSISVGATHLETDDSSTDTSGIFEALWEHLYTRRFGSGLEASYSLTDASVLNDTELNATGQFDSSDESGTFYETLLGANLFYRGIRSEVEVGIEGRELEYVDGPQSTAFEENDHYTYRAYLDLQRTLGRAATLQSGLEAEQKDYIDSEYTDTLYTATLGLDYALNRSLDLTSELEYQFGENDIPDADGTEGMRDYDEFQVTIGLHWDPFKRRRSNDVDTSFFELGLIN
ncbi:outer membrane beta-barrel protein [Granulosicoccaceae sp. 1_MG-2023]|nr:outer membrane beta-barrel protein [Granulosicoccaceae sp. 1_MG-2023]